MKVGVVDVYANHGFLVIGNRPETSADIMLDGLDGVAAVSSSHLLVATRGQEGLVRVSLWDGVGPRVGADVVAARLELPSGRLFVFDIEKVSVHSFATGRLGSVSVRASVDDPGYASRVDLLLGEEMVEREITSVAGYPLFPVTIESGTELVTADELDLILSGHDLPLSRLAAALKVIVHAPAIRPAVQKSRIDQVVEWSRWLSFRQSIASSRELGISLRAEIANLSEAARDDEVLGAAERTLANFAHPAG